MECYTCISNSGERRISPGPTIHEGKHWYVEHAYPVKMKGWLVLVLKRHVEALHELTAEEFSELGILQGAVARLLHEDTGCQKEYAMCFAEAEHFSHIHVHIVAKAHDLPDELCGPRIFAMLKPEGGDPLPPQEIADYCDHLRLKFEVERVSQVKGEKDGK